MEVAALGEVCEMPIGEISPYERNPRNNDEAVGAVAESIRQFGWQQPIVVDRDKVIIVGHTRWKAARELGLTSVPVVVAKDLTDDEVRAYRIADNSTGELATWDESLLAIELEGIDLDMANFGMTNDEHQEAAVDSLDEADDLDEDAVEARVSEGEVWRLGDHYLMCGSSASREDMARLASQYPDEPLFVFTDPPYGVAIGSRNKAINQVAPGKGGHVETDIEGDTMSADELRTMLTDAMTNLREICSDECSYYVSAPQGGDLGIMMLEMMRDAGLPVRHNLVWVKSSAAFSMGRLDYDYQHEPIFYTWTKSHRWNGGYKTSVIDDVKPLEKMNKTELKELVHALREGRGETSVLRADKPMASRLHPTMKPVKLVGRLMLNSSREGDVVADVFGGSGTTLVAAEQLGRRCLMMELDPHYCDVIIERWQQLTGKTAERVQTDG